MEAFLSAESTMAVLFITIVLGYAARKACITDDDFDASLSKLVMTITCPAMILDSALSNTSLPDNSVVLQLLLASLATFVPVALLALLASRLYRVPEPQRGVHAFTIAFSNTGFIGFGVVSAILGADAVLYASIYNIAFNLFAFSVGAWFMARSGSKRKTREEQLAYVRKNLASPAMIACVVTLALALAHITDFGVIGSTCDLLGAMTAPASMLTIGSTLARYQVAAMIKNGWVYVSAALRLLVVPAVTYFTAMPFVGDPFLLATMTLMSAMPVAALGTIMCLTFGGDLNTMSQCTFVTTVLSLLTIPLVTVCITAF